MDNLEARSLSPDKKEMLLKLKDQELSLLTQSHAIQSILNKLNNNNAYKFLKFDNISNEQYHSHELLAQSDARMNLIKLRASRDITLHERLVKQEEYISNLYNNNSVPLMKISHPNISETTSLSENYNKINKDNNISKDDYSVPSKSIVSMENNSSYRQLADIRVQRERAIANRLQQKQEALVMMESIRNQALREAKHKESMTIAKQYYFKCSTWKVLFIMDGLRKQRIYYRVAEFKWKVRILNRAFDHWQLKVQYYSRTNGNAIGILQKRMAWNYFIRHFFNQVRRHYNELELNLKSYYFRIRRYFKRILLEVAILGRKKRLTNNRMDQYRKHVHYNMFLISLQRVSRIRRSYLKSVIFHSEYICRRKLSNAFAFLFHYTIKMRSKRAVSSEYYWKTLYDSFNIWRNITDVFIQNDFKYDQAIQYYMNRSLDLAFNKWRYVFTRIYRQNQSSKMKRSKQYYYSIKRNLPLQHRIHKLLHQWYHHIRINKTKGHVRLIRQKKQNEILVSILQIWKSKVYQRRYNRRLRRKLVVLYLLKTGYLIFKNKIQILKSKRLKIRSNYQVRKNKLNKKFLIDGLYRWIAYLQRKKKYYFKLKTRMVGMKRIILLDSFKRWFQVSRFYRNSYKSYYQGRFIICKRTFQKFYHMTCFIKKKKKYHVAMKHNQKIQLIKYFQRWYDGLIKVRIVIKQKFKKSSLVLHRHEKISAWKEWKARHKILLYFRRKHYQLSVNHLKFNRMKKILYVWMHYLSIKDQFRSIRHTPYSLARRMTYLQRWLKAVEYGKIRSEHIQEIKYIRKMKLLSYAFQQLLQPLIHIHHENIKIKHYRQSISIPMKLKSFFKLIKLRIINKNAFKKDKRVTLHDKKVSNKLLIQWRLYRNKCMLDQENMFLSKRHFRIVKCLPAIALWKYMFHSFDMQTIANYKAKKIYKAKHLNPSFHLWHSYSYSRCMQYTALLSTKNHFLSKKWLDYKNRISHCKLIRHQFKSNLYRATMAHYRRNLKNKFHRLLEYVHLLKNYRYQKLIAKKKREKSLKHLIFNGLKSYYIEESLIYHGAKHWMKKAKKFALKSLKDLLYWKKILLNAMKWSKYRIRSRVYHNDLYPLIKQKRYRVYVTKKVNSLFKKRKCHSFLLKWHNATSLSNNRYALKSAINPTAPATTTTHQSIKSNLGKVASSSVSSKLQGHGQGQQIMKKLSHEERVQIVKAACERRKYIASYFKIKHTTIAIKSFRLRIQKKKSFQLVVSEAKKQLSVIYYSKALKVWLKWRKELQLSRVQSSIKADSIVLFRCSKVFPVLRSYVSIVKKEKYGDNYYITLLYSKALQTWCKYTDIYLDTTTSGVIQHKREDPKEMILDIWFQNTSSNMQAKDDYKKKKNKVKEGAPPIVIKVSIQHAHIRHAYEMHQQYQLLKRLSLWRDWTKKKINRSRAIRYAHLHFINKVMNILKLNVLNNKNNRAEYRRSNAVYDFLLIRRGYRRIKLNFRLNIATYKIHRIIKKKNLKHWRNVYRFAISSKKLKSLVLWIQYSQTMKNALYEWKVDTRIEAMVVEYLNDIRYKKKKSLVDVLITNCISRRRQRALIIRGRRFKTHNALHQVYANLLLNLEIIYRNKEIWTICDQHYLDFHRRHVLHSILLLRRNRIAHNYNLRKKFNILLQQLRLNKYVIKHNKHEMNKANMMIMKKLFHRLYSKAKLNNSKKKQINRVIGGGVIGGGVIGGGVIGGGGFLQQQQIVVVVRKHYSDRIQILIQWHNTYMHKIYLSRLQERVFDKRLIRRQDRKCNNFYFKARLYRYFRKLLSHARKRNLKRRNSALLQKYWMNLKVRRVISKLDMNVASKWMVTHDMMRLMSIHARKQDLKRGLQNMSVNIKQQQHPHQEQLDIYQDEDHRLSIPLERRLYGRTSSSIEYKHRDEEGNKNNQ